MTCLVMQFQRLPMLAGGSRGPRVPMRLGGGETQAASLCVSVSLGADSVHWGQYWGNAGIWRDQVYGTGVLGYVV